MKTDINSYHCLCSHLLLATTHTISALPQRRRSSNESADYAVILPLPATPPAPQSAGPSSSYSSAALPSCGYTILVGLVAAKSATLIRREDGFEKRILYRCARCRVVCGYALEEQSPGLDAMDIDGHEKGKEKEDDDYGGKVIYILPAGITDTATMRGRGRGKKIGEEDVDIGAAAVPAFEVKT